MNIFPIPFKIHLRPYTYILRISSCLPIPYVLCWFANKLGIIVRYHVKWPVCAVRVRLGTQVAVNYSGQKKKLSAPEKGQNCPPMVKSQTFWVPVSCKTPTIIHWYRKDLSHINRKKLFCMFRGGMFLFLITVVTQLFSETFNFKIWNKQRSSCGITHKHECRMF